MDAVIDRGAISAKLQEMKKKAADAQAKNKNRVTQPFQTFGLELAEKLGDRKHTGIYIRLAKTRKRSELESALNFVIDSNANSKPRLFMWKLKEMRGAK